MNKLSKEYVKVRNMIGTRPVAEMAQQETVANLSAQIRNRLTYILLSASMLRIDLQAELSKEQEQELLQIDRTAKEIQSIIDSLIAFIPTEKAVGVDDENIANLAVSSENQAP